MAEQNAAADPAGAQQADPAGGAQQAQQPAQANQAEPQGTDWKAQARKWEERAKANKDKADLWDAQQQAAPTVEALQAQIDEMKQAQAQAEKAAERARTLMEVSQATGVPADLLKGETAEELEASAKLVNDFVARKQPGYPSDKGGGSNGAAVTRESIEAIKDPAARIKARAEHIDLYR